MSNELHPCPFCGGPAEQTRVSTSKMFGTTVLYGCTNPDCNAFNEPMAFTRKVWNNRPVEDAMRAKWNAIPWAAIELSASASGSDDLFMWLNMYQPRNDEEEAEE